MKYSLVEVVDLLRDLVPRTSKDVADIISADWRAVDESMTLEQALDEAYSREAIAGDSGGDAARKRSNFTAILVELVQPVASPDNVDSVVVDLQAK